MIIKIPSDYDKNTSLQIVRNVDGDICLKIFGRGEMRLATNGYQLPPEKQLAILKKFNEIIDIMES